MKKLGFLFLFIVLLFTGYSQTDTLHLKGNKKIPCKITEIGESEIKYKTPDNLDGPVYVMALSKIYKYTLSTGNSVLVAPDELLVENQHGDIMSARSVIKIHPFSFVNNQISMAYEQVIKMGMNLDVELGYINNNIMPSTGGSNFYTSEGAVAFMSGFYIKPGVKFLLGQDYSLKGMKYAHPLKGRFLRLDVVFSYMNYQNVASTTSQTFSQSPVFPYTQTITTTSRNSNINVFGYGGMINYGRQFILGNVMTFEYFIGVGVTLQSSFYENPETTTTTYVYDPTNPNSYYPYYAYYGSGDASQISNYHAFFRIPDVGLSGTFGIRLGFIVPEKKPMPKVD
ncbi:MAG: hypothetical protein MUF75_09710 [Bacteroidia bacterium]|jgi:hypothetical protein|nr:hypothetical protein [Bacteroidia bacterium]